MVSVGRRCVKTTVMPGRYFLFFFFQAEDGIRDLVRSRGLGDVYKRQLPGSLSTQEKKKSILAPQRVGYPVQILDLHIGRFFPASGTGRIQGVCHLSLIHI